MRLRQCSDLVLKNQTYYELLGANDSILLDIIKSNEDYYCIAINGEVIPLVDFLRLINDAKKKMEMDEE